MLQYDILQCSSGINKYRVYFNICGKAQSLTYIINYVNERVQKCSGPEKDKNGKDPMFVDNIYNKSTVQLWLINSYKHNSQRCYTPKNPMLPFSFYVLQNTDDCIEVIDTIITKTPYFPTYLTTGMNGDALNS